MTAALKNQTNHETDIAFGRVDLAALSFCLRDSEKHAAFPCTFGTHDRDSPEPLRNQFSVIFDGILTASTVLFKNLHILYHGMNGFAIFRMHKRRNWREISYV